MMFKGRMSIPIIKKHVKEDRPDGTERYREARVKLGVTVTKGQFARLHNLTREDRAVRFAPNQVQSYKEHMSNKIKRRKTPKPSRKVSVFSECDFLSAMDF